MRSQSDYNFWFDRGTLIIVDKARPGSNFMSVTNNLENILEDISRMIDKNLVGTPIVYADSEGNYDGVELLGRGKIEFIPIQEKDRQKAILELNIKRSSK
jgi:hypothetical protein